MNLLPILGLVLGLVIVLIGTIGLSTIAWKYIDEWNIPGPSRFIAGALVPAGILLIAATLIIHYG